MRPWTWLVACSPLAVAVALLPLRDEIAPANVTLVLVVVVLVAAIVGGRVGGAVAALIAAASFDFFFTRPYYSFTINARDDIETTILLLVVGLVVGEIVVRSRRAQQVAFERDQDVRRMQRYAQLGAGGEPPGHLIRVAETELTDLLDIDSCWFERPPFAVTLPTVGHGRVTVWGDESGISAMDPAPSSLVALPVFGDGEEQGRFVLDLGRGRTVSGIGADRRALAVALADRLGTALAHSR
ncbi:MAG TPA: DUF4118 domain-containing protein [Acidimicrobiia bacterium]|nr:DUF4118 domain-containing protein [Acidimicrobiia bacterium]